MITVTIATNDIALVNMKDSVHTADYIASDIEYATIALALLSARILER